MRLVGRYLASAGFMVLGATLASAQMSVDAGLGFGAAFDKTNGAGIDNAGSSNAFGSCVPGTGDSFCQTTSSMSGFFMGLGGDVMLNKRFGVGAEFSFQPVQKNYGPLQDRQMFYDFNGIYRPISTKRVALELEGGIGGARTSFSYTQNSCIGSAVCTASAQPVGAASHFQVHVGVGVQVYLTEHVFIRPQFDYRYVPNFTQQFNSNSVPAAMVWIGYHFGER